LTAIGGNDLSAKTNP
jgi:hypothetical protein